MQLCLFPGSALQASMPSCNICEAVHVAARSYASGSVYRCWCEEDAGN